jgi:hypothetical protein
MRPHRPVATVSLLLLAAILVARPAAGDGGLVGPYDYTIAELDQLALVCYDSQQQREDLYLQPLLRGDAADFAWIVPLPGEPELDTAPENLFRELIELTRPLRRQRGSSCDRVDEIPIVSPQGDERAITVLQHGTVGIYVALVLSADDAAQLADSLAAWGFLHEENRQAVEPALQYYVDQAWYFVALRLAPGTQLDPQNQIWTHTTMPVRFSFAAPAPIYPLRISSISAEASTPLILFVLAERRMTFAGGETQYANRFDDPELEKLGQLYPELATVIDHPGFLTRLYRQVSLSEMDRDLPITPAPHDGEFRQIDFSGIPVADPLLLALGIPGLVWLVRRRKRFVN